MKPKDKPVRALLHGATLIGWSLGLVSCGALDALVCETPQCQFSRAEWTALRSLANLGLPPPDPSNKHVGNPAAERLGQKFYFDTRFSGDATQVDSLRRPTPHARAPRGQPTGIACATCHVPSRAGIDPTSVPGHVSIGAGLYDVNAQPSVNAAYYTLLYWNGRVDSLWAQALAVAESVVSMAGNRLHIAWVIFEKYRDEYQSVFKDDPLPFDLSSTAVASIVDGRGQCKLGLNQQCPAPNCHSVNDGATVACLPRFPLEGRPGAIAGCQPGSISEPFFDAFDCMFEEDRRAVTRVLVNFGKAIAAYEYTLLSRNSAFDQFMEEGPQSTKLSPASQRGARLFVGKAACNECHSTPLFSNNQFENIGVPQVGPGIPTEADCPENGVCDCVNGKNCLPWGAWDGLSKLRSNTFRRDSAWSDAPSDASRLTWVSKELDDSLKGAWRTPSLRDVALTEPYMHNGIYQTLEEVVWHYNVGGSAAGSVGTSSKRLRPLGLSDAEQRDLVAFLKSLTGAPLPAGSVAAPSLP
jgi:cytochrome c peroxidase